MTINIEEKVSTWVKDQKEKYGLIGIHLTINKNTSTTKDRIYKSLWCIVQDKLVDNYKTIAVSN